MRHIYTLTTYYTAGQLRLEKHRKINSKLHEVLKERDYLLGLADHLYLGVRDSIVRNVSALYFKTDRTNSNDNQLRFKLLPATHAIKQLTSARLCDRFKLCSIEYED